MRPSILIYNPTAGRGGQRAMLERLLPILEDGGFAVEPRATAAPGDATDLARAAAGEGAEVVFVLGGDGTVREAAAGLGGRGGGSGGTGTGAAETALAILPGGTTNVLAHALGLPPAPLAAARAHAGHPVRRLDVGLCDGQPFLMMASGGYDGFLLERMDPTWKSRFGKLGIALQALFHVGRYRFPRLALRVDGEELEASFFAVCNVPFYAGTFELCPAAAFDDRRLDLVTFTGRGPVATAGFSLDVARGLHVARADVVIRPAGRVEIHAPEALPLQLDGDAFGCTPPVVIELADEPVPVLAPAPHPGGQGRVGGGRLG